MLKGSKAKSGDTFVTFQFVYKSYLLIADNQNATFT